MRSSVVHAVLCLAFLPAALPAQAPAPPSSAPFRDKQIPHEAGFRLRREPRAPKEALWIVIAVGRIEPGWAPFLGLEADAVPA